MLTRLRLTREAEIGGADRRECFWSCIDCTTVGDFAHPERQG